MRTIPLEDAVAMIPDGAALMIGGDTGCGTPETLIDELVRQQKRDLVVIANDAARPGVGVGKLVTAGCLRKIIVSQIGLNPEARRRMADGDLEVDLVPQDTLVERLRAGGSGTGVLAAVGAVDDEGRQRLNAACGDCLLEAPLRADFALVQAFLCDYLGNLVYALRSRNINPLIAAAADTVVVRAEHIVPVGIIDPDHVVTPAPLVDYVIANAPPVNAPAE